MRNNHRVAKVYLIGEHPHNGESGYLLGDTPSSVTSIQTLSGTKMYLVELIDCKHGTDACYAEFEQMRLDKRETSK